MINMFRYIFVLLFIAVPVFSQTNNNIVAKVGDKEITISEFRERFELMPHVTVRQFNEDSTKLDFLYSLVAEKLWALEAENKGLESSEIIKYAINDLEKMYVRDALFKREVESKVTVTDKDISLGMSRIKIQLELDIFSSMDSVLIKSIYESLITGASFDSLKIIYNEIISSEPAYISFGDLGDEIIEDSLYSLKPGQFTVPLNSAYGWFIFRLNKIGTKTLNPNEIQKYNSFVKDRIKERRAMKEGTKYLSKLLSGKLIDIDKTLFRTLSDKVYEIIFNKTPSNTSTPYILSEFDIRDILSSITDADGSASFIKFEKNPVTLKEYLFSLTLSGFTVNKLSPGNVDSKLASAVKAYTEKELITREGLRQDLNRLPEIKKDIQLWKENYLAQILRNSFTDSARVSEDEIYQQYLKTLKDSSTVTQVNITEVLTDNLDVIEHVLNEIENGKDFKSLAMEYTKRNWVKERGGEFGLFPVTMFGEIGRIAGGLNVGEVYGPLTTSEGYSIFKVIDKVEGKSTFSKSFDEAKNQIKNNLFAEKLDKIFNSQTKALAKKYGITINESSISNLKLTNVQMFTYRFMGFGGRITAVPYTKPWYEWYHQLKSDIKEVP
jgi:parvulin-like peptidyl-prolyl isomerase